MSFDDKQLTVFQDSHVLCGCPQNSNVGSLSCVQLTFRLSDFYKL